MRSNVVRFPRPVRTALVQRTGGAVIIPFPLKRAPTKVRGLPASNPLKVRGAKS